jgi:hypothetical protein
MCLVVLENSGSLNLPRRRPELLGCAALRADRAAAQSPAAGSAVCQTRQRRNYQNDCQP